MGEPMVWRSVSVQGRRASYGVLGEGRTVVFLHGWGLSDRTYRRGLSKLAGAGVRVVAPALPGFGGNAPLPASDFSLEGYAAWVDEFLREVEVDGATTLVGHSFGGGVAIQTAHDHPDRVAQLVLVNSIGGSTWRHRGGRSRHMRERPVWDWGLHLSSHVLSPRTFSRILPVIAADAVPNAVRRPRTLWEVGRLARDADLVAELDELRRRALPVAVLWGRDDTVIPWASATSLVEALGDPHLLVVPGDHSWLLSDPARFAEVLTNVINLADDGARAS